MATERPILTGFFTDDIRRIDIILVLQDDGYENSDKIKANFLLNALKIGLEIEIEQGMMKKHQKLIFVKMHAPDPVVEQYGYIFNIRKYFKDSHIEFVNAENKYLKRVKQFIPFFTNTRERKWIKLVRRQYPGPSNYSTLERSQIVYRILLVLPFGVHENHVGLERLIRNNIILDAYALHDGPYFFVPKQDVASEVSARQILYSNWIGADALIKPQPVSLLQEYFGEKVAFYFAFCEYINRALIIAAGAGMLTLYTAIMEIRSQDSTFKRRSVDEFFCWQNNQDNTYICPKCRDFNTCPFYKALDYCNEVRLKFTLESPRMVKFDIFMIFWAIVFVLLWRRRENYLSWLWEMDKKDSNIIRPDYKVNFKSIRRSEVTGILKNFESVWVKIFKILKSILILFILLLIIFPTTVLWANFQYIVIKKITDGLKRSRDESHFAGLAAFSTVYITVNGVLEKVIEKLSLLAARLENHKTQDTYERSLIQKQFGAAFAFMFSYFVFIAFIKGRIYTYPVDLVNWKMIGGIGMMNCGLFTCVDELCVLLCMATLLRSIVLKAIPPLFRFRTDYNHLRSINAKIPCWEREYQLNNVNEQFIMNIFKNQAMQFALSTLFVQAFPLAPFFVLIGNVLNIRYNSWLLLLGSRRPLLHNATGMANWRNIIAGIAFASAITNVLMMGLNTRTARFQFYEAFGNTYHTTYDYTKTSSLGTPGYAYKEYKGMKPNECYYLGRWSVYKNKMSPMIYEWTCRATSMQKLLLFQHLTLLTLLIPVFLINSYPKDIKETLAIEERIQQQCFARRKPEIDENYVK